MCRQASPAAWFDRAMPKLSAGLLPYRRRGRRLEVFLVHPGGPFWASRDAQAWSIAKGEPEAGEALVDAARREFREETGLACDGPLLALPPAPQPGGKVVHAWAIEADLDAGAVRSNSFRMEWPPGSGEVRAFPEIDRAAWFDLATARRKIHRGQAALLDALAERLGVPAR